MSFLLQRLTLPMDGDMPNEEVSAQQNRDNSEFDDIHVPGLGVRGALADDGPQPSRVWSRARDAYSRRSEFLGQWTSRTASVGQWTSRTAKDVRLAGSRQVVKLTKIGNECKVAVIDGRKFAGTMASSARVRFQTMHVRLAAGTHIAALKLRGEVKHRLAPSFARSLRESRARFLRVAQTASVHIDRARTQRWPRILGELRRHSGRAKVFLAGKADLLEARVRRPVVAQFNSRRSRNLHLDLATWRRASPALAALLVIAAFVFQLIASKR